MGPADRRGGRREPATCISARIAAAGGAQDSESVSVARGMIGLPWWGGLVNRKGMMDAKTRPAAD